jgi:hypothetical protein
MEEWVSQVCRELELDLVDPDLTVNQVLDLTADVAHGVARPAAPVTAFLIGLAAGRSTRPDETVAELARTLGERAKNWKPSEAG